LRASANTHFGYGEETIKKVQLTDPNILLNVPTKRKQENPFLSLNLQLTYEALKRCNIGVQSGVQLNFKEPFFYGRDVTYLFPI
jgi:hypothetical protein